MFLLEYYIIYYRNFYQKLYLEWALSGAKSGRRNPAQSGRIAQEMAGRTGITHICAHHAGRGHMTAQLALVMTIVQVCLKVLIHW